MKYANKSHGNGIREAYAMSNKVHSLHSEHRVPTPISKSVLSQFSPFFFAKLQMHLHTPQNKSC